MDEHLADQLLLLFSMAGAGSFTTTVISEHTRTNIDVIQRFLPVHIAVSDWPKGGRKVEVTAKSV